MSNVTLDKVASIIPSRPWSVYLVALWSFLRAASPLVLIIGQFQLYTVYGTPERPFGADTSFLEWSTSPSMLSILVPSLGQTVAFSCFAIGILLGKSWARSGFLWASLILLIWNLRGIVLAGTWSLYSLIALPLASWYFRRPDVLNYFIAQDMMPRWLKYRIGRVPIDLAIALGILVVCLVLEMIQLIVKWDVLRSMF